jgi:hypothetical protein
MISSTAMASFDWLVRQSLQETCRPGGECEISLRARALSEPDPAETDLLLLNISSYQFRLMSLFHFCPDQAWRAQLGSILRSPDAVAEHAMQDAHGELANMVCGAINRTLAREFRHVGMSTPLRLDPGCLGHFPMLNPDQVWTYAIDFGSGGRFALSICLFLNQGESLDFRLDQHAAEEESAGELELF